MGYEQGYPRLPAEIENTCFEISRPVGLASSSTESRGFCSSMAGAGIYSRTAVGGTDEGRWEGIG